MIEDIITDIVRRRAQELDKLVREAFQQHFGFPFEDADKSKLERLLIQGDPLQKFCYKGEVFLLYHESA